MAQDNDIVHPSFYFNQFVEVMNIDVDSIKEEYLKTENERDWFEMFSLGEGKVNGLYAELLEDITGITSRFWMKAQDRVNKYERLNLLKEQKFHLDLKDIWTFDDVQQSKKIIEEIMKIRKELYKDEFCAI